MSKQKNINLYWIIGVAVLVVIGVGIYFWLSGGDGGSVTNTGGNIPSPPALPG